MISLDRFPKWFSTMRAGHDAEERAALDVWRRAISARGKVDEKQLRQAMALLGKTVADLEAALANRTQRAEWREQALRIGELQQQIDANAQQVRNAMEAHKQALLDHEKRLHDLRMEENALQRELQPCLAAAERLRQGRPELMIRAQELRERVGVLRETLRMGRAAVATIEAEMSRAEELILSNKNAAQNDPILAERLRELRTHNSGNLQARLATQRNDVKKQEAELSDIAKELAELDTRMLEV